MADLTQEQVEDLKGEVSEHADGMFTQLFGAMDRMLKGMGMEDEEAANGADDNPAAMLGEGEEKGDGEDEEDPDDAGFEDMELGEQYLDVTEFLGGLQELIKGQAREIRELTRTVRRQSATIGELQAGQRVLAKGVHSGLTELAKGMAVAELHDRETAPSAVDEQRVRRVIPRVIPRNREDGSVSTIGEFSKQKLVKARLADVITPEMLSLYQHKGVFHPDQRPNQDLIKKVKAL